MCCFSLRGCLHADLRCYALGILMFSLISFVYFLTQTSPQNATDDTDSQQPVPLNSSVSGPGGLLLVLIHASGRGSGVREAIRNTWVSPALFARLDPDIRHRVDYRFVLGIQGISTDLLANLTAEASLYDDMLLLEDVSDQHSSLSLRTLRSFQHVAAQMGHFLYVLKCDDDSFVNLLTVTQELAERTSNTGYYWGQFLGAGGIIKEGPYAEHRWSVCETYFPYALGGGYVLSMDLIQLVARTAPYLMVYNNEDVSLGAWLAPYNMDLVFDARFNTGAISKGCKKPYIVIHRVGMEKMYNYFDAMMREGYICTRNNYWFVWHGYRYNWKVSPSKCCRIRRRIP